MNRRAMLKHVALLLGGVASSSAIQAVWAGVNESTSIISPILGAEQKKQIETLAELIIPETDTPGAIEAGVPHFIEVMVSDWYTETERSIFLAGLAALDAFSRQHFGRHFNACDKEQQIQALRNAERESHSSAAMNFSPDFINTHKSDQEQEKAPFFSKIKELTVLGYYTSKVGATQELRYNPMPMKYEGDYNFAEVGRQWSW